MTTLITAAKETSDLQATGSSNLLQAHINKGDI